MTSITSEKQDLHQLLLDFTYSIGLCDNMGDVKDDLANVWQRFGQDLPMRDDGEIDNTELSTKGAVGLWSERDEDDAPLHTFHRTRILTWKGEWHEYGDIMAVSIDAAARAVYLREIDSASCVMTRATIEIDGKTIRCSISGALIEVA